MSWEREMTVMRHRKAISSRTVLRIVWSVFAFVGTMLVVAGIVTSSVSARRSEERTATATATIVDVEAHTSRDSDGYDSTSYYPVLRFEDSDHEEHTVTQNVSSGRYEVGDVVEVSYDPRHPDDNVIMRRDEGTAGFVSVILWIMGGVFFVIGVSCLAGSLFARI